MNEVKTANIISTPDITGNIGSCTTKTEDVLLHGGFFRDTGVTIATNSCTGQAEKLPYSDIHLAPFIVAMGMAIVILAIWAGNRSND